MPNVRRWVAPLAVVLAAACASSNTGIAVSVAEVRPTGRRTPTAGDHYYRIRVTNRSAEPIAVESIHIELAGMTELDVDDATQQFDETIGAGEMRVFDMDLHVYDSRAVERAPRGGASFTANIDSLRVMVNGRNEKGTFSDSGDYPIGVEQPDR